LEKAHNRLVAPEVENLSSGKKGVSRGKIRRISLPGSPEGGRRGDVGEMGKISI